MICFPRERANRSSRVAIDGITPCWLSDMLERETESDDDVFGRDGIQGVPNRTYGRAKLEKSGESLGRRTTMMPTNFVQASILVRHFKFLAQF